MARLVIAFALAGCSTSPPSLATCADSLAGTWATERGEWMLIDRGTALEGYPLFDDSREPAGDPAIEIAPRAIDLRRDEAAVVGEISRRYMRGSDACIAKVPLRVLACSGDVIEVILADPSPPAGFAPCIESARKSSSRREKWRRTHR